MWKKEDYKMRLKREENPSKSRGRLPYGSPALLSWEDGHWLRNAEGAYCYCGAGGDWWRRMARCAGCRQWFHERCLTPGRQGVGVAPAPLMAGDGYYAFVCAVCNGGAGECRKRLEEFGWGEMVHLAMFDLTVRTSILFHRTKEDFLHLFTDQAEFSALSPPRRLAKLKSSDREERVRLALEEGERAGAFVRRNIGGQECWRLKTVAPARAPKVEMPGSCGFVSERTVMQEAEIAMPQTPFQPECRDPVFQPQFRDWRGRQKAREKEDVERRRRSRGGNNSTEVMNGCEKVVRGKSSAKTKKPLQPPPGGNGTGGGPGESVGRRRKPEVPREESRGGGRVSDPTQRKLPRVAMKFCTPPEQFPISDDEEDADMDGQRRRMKAVMSVRNQASISMVEGFGRRRSSEPKKQLRQQQQQQQQQLESGGSVLDRLIPRLPESSPNPFLVFESLPRDKTASPPPPASSLRGKRRAREKAEAEAATASLLARLLREERRANKKGGKLGRGGNGVRRRFEDPKVRRGLHSSSPSPSPRKGGMRVIGRKKTGGREELLLLVRREEAEQVEY